MKLKRMLVTVSAVEVISTVFGTQIIHAADSKQDKTLNVTVQANPTTIDPAKASDAYSQSIVDQVMEGLYTFDKNGKVAPGAATKIVKPTANGTKYIFSLRKDAKWSNGDPVTAQDFVVSLQHEVAPKTASQNAASYLSFIKNFSAVNKGTKPVSELGVKALGYYKLEVTLSSRVPYFNSLLATGFYPADKKVLNKYGKDYAKDSTKMVYNGPYTLQGWKGTNDTWTYVKDNKFHAAKNVRIKKVVATVSKEDSTSYNMFQSGKIQETAISGEYVANNKGNKELHTVPGASLNYLNFNTNKKPMTNVHLRRAFNYLLDRQSLANSVLNDGSLPANNMVPKGIVKNSQGKDFYSLNGGLAKYDLKRAKAEWKAFEKESHTSKLTLKLLTADDSTSHKLGEFVQSSAQKNLKGLSISINPQPVSQRIASAFAGKYDLVATGWETSYDDPQGFLTVVQKDGTANFPKWNDAQFNQLMDKAAKQTGNTRWQTIAKANKRLNNQVPDTPLYNQVVAHFLSKDIGGIKYTSTSPQALYRYAYWK
ncbi:peptide ABC transporter substrate-binding protein [Furfurilactobacillus rossiae]|uniref:peptide ABC transporter substrate-binding protein n=1 Tax=Furfurilactobacillus rossiae TaxID=231049 RepID=UPI001F3DE334|nr:peptide ABC transporter substrate-binding protein [Furfurilactobacillus rossiae]MCF6166078.1 peptide ABC transporter substrate-binding protein [Furfurilactobacillus rossiae]